MKRRFYPIALNVLKKSCLVVGTDEAVVEKASRLADAGAEVALVWDPITPEAAELGKRGIQLLRRRFDPIELSGQFLVVLSRKTDDGLADQVARRCREKRILLAALDRPALCDVVHLSLFDRGKLRIGISTEGAAPGLARKIREGLESSIGAEPLEAFLDDLAALRQRLETEIPDFDKRRQALLDAIEGFDFRAKVTFPGRWLSEKGRKS